MNKKSKLFFSLVSLCFSLAILVFGVYSAMSVSYTVSGNVSYTINDVFVNISTKLYRSKDTVLTDEYLQGANLNSFEQGSVPNGLEDSGTVIEDVISYDEKNNTLESGTYEKENNLDLKYGTYSTSDNTSYAYYVVMMLSNYSTKPAYATIQNNTTGDVNSLIRISNDTTLPAKKSGEDCSTTIMVIALALDDATKNTNGEFSFKVNVSKNVQIQTLSLSNTDNIAQSEVAFKDYGLQTNGLVVQTQLYDLIEPTTLLQAVDGYMYALLGNVMDALTMGVYHLTINNVDQAKSNQVLISLYSGVEQEYIPATMYFGFPGTIASEQVLMLLMGAFDNPQSLIFNYWDKDLHGFILDLDLLSGNIINNSLTFTLAIGYLNQDSNVTKQSNTIFSLSYLPTTTYNVNIVSLDDETSTSESVSVMKPKTFESAVLSGSYYFYDKECRNKVSMPFVPTKDTTLYLKTYDSGKIYDISKARENSTIDLLIANKKYATFTRDSLLQIIQLVTQNQQQQIEQNDFSDYASLVNNIEGVSLNPEQCQNLAAYYHWIWDNQTWAYLCFDYMGNDVSCPIGKTVIASYEKTSLGVFAFSYDTYDIVKLVYSNTNEELPFEDGSISMD